jgi:hypothetical protein
VKIGGTVGRAVSSRIRIYPHLAQFVEFLFPLPDLVAFQFH